MKHVRSLKTHAEKCEEYRKFVKNGTDCVICSRSFESKGTTALYMHLTRSHKNELLEFGKEGWYFICILKYLEKILKGSLDSMPSPSTSVKIQIMGGKVFENKKFVDITQQCFALLITSRSSKLSSP